MAAGYIRQIFVSMASWGSSPVSIQTQSLALRALRKRKPQETQALRWQTANHGCHTASTEHSYWLALAFVA